MWHRFYGTDVLRVTQCCSPNAKPTTTTRHAASTSTHWHCAFRICCHSNKTGAPIENLPNSAQLEGTPYHSPKLHVGPCSSVHMQRGTDRQTHRRAWLIYISCHLRFTQNVAIHLPALYAGRTRWASPEKNIHSITPHPRGYYTTSLVNFRHFLRSTASSLHICWVWQFFSITSVQAFLACIWVLHFPLHNSCILLPSHLWSFLKTCPYHLNLCCCTDAITSTIPSLSTHYQRTCLLL